MSKGQNLKIATAGLVAAVAIVSPRAASAEPVALSVSVTTSLQQTMNHPCLIGDPSCHNPDGFAFTLIPPNTSSATLSSPTYTVDQIRTIVGGDTFEVGLDLNQAMGKDGGAYDLLRFTLSVNGTIFFSTTGPTTLTPTSAGNGYSDAGIFTFDLSSFSPSDALVFTTTFARGTAGREQYFLQGVSGGTDNAPVPEPASMILLGTGLVGAAAARKRMRRTQA